MNTIVPSTKLKLISVGRLTDTTCLRRYFWRRVLNLEPRKLNLNFWYGGVLGATFEALLLGKNWRKAMKAGDKARCKRQIIDSDSEEEIALQRRLIEVIIAGAVKHPEVKHMKLRVSQKSFKVRLEASGLTFIGILDGEGIYRNRPSMFESKTATRVSGSYISALSFDKQIHGYGYGQRIQGRRPLPQCCYCIFPKPQKRVKRHQTLDDFVEEIRLDTIARPEKYYIFLPITLGRTTITETGADIERIACILKHFYDTMTEKQLLDPHNWPKQEGRCSDYKGCEYLALCRNSSRWEVYLPMFQQRQIIFEEQRQELKGVEP